MEQTFLTELRINKVRHLHDITIPLSKTERKNLILTGKNGSGKTSVLRSMAMWLNVLVHVPEEYWTLSRDEATAFLRNYWSEYLSEKSILNKLQNKQDNDPMLQFFLDTILEMNHNRKLLNLDQPLDQAELRTTVSAELDNRSCSMGVKHKNSLYSKFNKGQFILAFYGDDRKLDVSDIDHIEKVQLKSFYGMKEKPAKELGKYLVDLEVTKSMAQARNNSVRVIEIENWFNRFENILRRIYGEPSLKLDFNIDTFQFSILIDGREPFDFNTMSMGYAAVFDIVADLMMRMESQRRYDLEGIVLIDEIETHLHVELQKQIVPILTELFPNIQFILTTHSPFILNSAPNAVIYDLEKRILVEEGMENLSYEGNLDGYFEVDRFSQKLRKAFEEYKQLVTSANLSDLDYARIAELEDYLDEVPDYLALDFAHEYSRLKAEFDS